MSVTIGLKRTKGCSQGARRALRCWTQVLAVLLAVMAGGHVQATQHLVRPGEPWSDLAPRIRPGDEIILMPGRHQAGSLDDLTGTREQPIIIRSVHPDHPAIIEARREGIRLRRPQHVIIRDLTITAASIAGIVLTDEPEPPPPPGFPDERTDREKERETQWPAHVTIRNVTIEKTGPRGRRHGIRLTGVDGVHIERTRIDGWGGSAIKIVASTNVVVEHCQLRGRHDHGQLSGIQIRAGSSNIRVSRSTIIDAGESAVVLGGQSRPEEYRPPRTVDPSAEPVYEARRVTVERCIIERGESAFAFVGADHCTVRNNAVINPARWAYFVATPSSEGREPYPAVRQSVFGANLIVWDSGALRALTFVQPPASAAELEIQQNLWWAPEEADASATTRELAGTATSPQVFDVDPELDDAHRPRNARARIFGPDGP